MGFGGSELLELAHDCLVVVIEYVHIIVVFVLQVFDHFHDEYDRAGVIGDVVTFVDFGRVDQRVDGFRIGESAVARLEDALDSQTVRLDTGGP